MSNEDAAWMFHNIARKQADDWFEVATSLAGALLCVHEGAITIEDKMVIDALKKYELCYWSGRTDIETFSDDA